MKLLDTKAQRYSLVLFVIGLVPLWLSWVNSDREWARCNWFTNALILDNSCYWGSGVLYLTLFWVGLISVVVGFLGAFTPLYSWLNKKG